MDYTTNKSFGKLVNLKEKFFEKVAEISMNQLPLHRSEGESTSIQMRPFRFKLLHDQGTSRIVVYTNDEATAKQLIMKAEGCPERAIVRIGA